MGVLCVFVLGEWCVGVCLDGGIWDCEEVVCWVLEWDDCCWCMLFLCLWSLWSCLLLWRFWMGVMGLCLIWYCKCWMLNLWGVSLWVWSFCYWSLFLNLWMEVVLIENSNLGIWIMFWFFWSFFFVLIKLVI